MNHPHPPIPIELVQMEDLLFDLEKRGRVSIPRYGVEFNANPGKSGKRSFRRSNPSAPVDWARLWQIMR